MENKVKLEDKPKWCNAWSPLNSVKVMCNTMPCCGFFILGVTRHTKESYYQEQVRMWGKDKLTEFKLNIEKKRRSAEFSITRDRKVETIKIKNYPYTVIRMLVSELNLEHCSKRFLDMNLSDDTEVYLKCDINGRIEYRGKRNEYRTHKIM